MSTARRSRSQLMRMLENYHMGNLVRMSNDDLLELRDLAGFVRHLCEHQLARRHPKHYKFFNGRLAELKSVWDDHERRLVPVARPE